MAGVHDDPDLAQAWEVINAAKEEERRAAEMKRAIHRVMVFLTGKLVVRHIMSLTGEDDWGVSQVSISCSCGFTTERWDVTLDELNQIYADHLTSTSTTAGQSTDTV